MFVSYLRSTLSASVRVAAHPRTLVQKSKSAIRTLPIVAALAALAVGLATSAGAQTFERFSRYSGNTPFRPAAGRHVAVQALAHSEQSAAVSNRLNLGSVGAGKTSPEGEVTFTFTRSATLGSIDVLSAGAPSSEFADSGTGSCQIGRAYSAGDTCTVKLTLTPKSSGLRSSAVVLKDSSNALFASAIVEGSGNRAQVIFFPGTLSSPITGIANDLGIAVDGSGNLYINSNVAFAGNPPPGIKNGDYVLIKEILQNDGTYAPSYLFDFGPAGVDLGGIALDAAGNVYVPDSVSNQGGIYKFTAASSYAMSYILSGSFISSNDVAFDAAGNMYIADYGDVASTTTTPDNTGGLYKSLFNGSTFAAPTKIFSGECVAVAVDGSGNVFASFVTAQTSATPQTPAGIPTASNILKWPSSLASHSTVDSSFTNVTGITIDPAGNLYIADDNSEGQGQGTPGIFMETPNGASYIKSPVALAASISFQTATQILPEDVAIDGNGNLYAAVNTPQGSSNHEEVFELNYATPPTLSFGSVQVGNISSSQSVQLKNIGNLPLSISTPASGTNPSPSAGYLVTGGTCPILTPSTGPGILASNASCTYQIAFDPTIAGSQPGSVVITDNEQVSSTQSIPTNGTGLATHFVLSSYATTQASGVSFTINVTAQTAGNTTDTGYAGVVHFTTSDGAAVLPANAFLSSGTGTFTLTLNTPGTQTITVTDTVATTLTATTSNINVTSAAATHFHLVAPASTTSGSSFSITLTALSASNATATGYAGTVHFTTSDAQGILPANYTFVPADNGVHVFSGVTLKTVGNQTITGTDTVTASITGTSSAISVTAGAPATVAVSSGSGQSTTVNTAFANPLVALVTDAGGNPVPGVLVTFTAPVQNSASATFAGGVNTATTNASGIATSVAVSANSIVGSYIVTASAAGAATSANFSLTNTGTGPVITTNPVSQTVNAGSTATFTAAASGSPTPTVQWQVSTDGGATFSNIAGATSTTLSFTAAAGQNGNKYRAVFTNASGTATTTAATLTVNSAPTITTNPVSQSVSAGSTATFTAAASGNPTPTVQWQVSTDGGATFSNIAGATSTTLSFTAASGQNGNQFRAVFTNAVGSATTTAATLTVTAGPVITTNPVSQTVNAGSTATFTAAASGNPTPTVQWQVSTDGGATFSNIAGATSTTLSFTAAAGQNGNKYRAVFTNASGTATTTAATLTVNSAPTITTNPVSQSVSAGSTATFTAAASGNPTPTVQWQVSTDGGATFSNISGATSTTLSFTAASGQNGNRYRAVFTNTVGSATTTAATLTVTAGPVITTNPVSQTVPFNSTVTFTAAASGTPSPTVQWQVSTNGGATFSNISGATSTSLVLSGVTVSMSGNMYRAVFTNTSGSATTTAATLTVTKITPTITWATPADILFGSALGSGQLNATANVAGTFSYSPAAGAVLPVGSGQTLSVTFTPTDSVDYTQATKSVLINVNAATGNAANLISTSVLTRDQSGSILVTITVANTGGTAASNVALTGVTLGGVSSSAVPVALGAIPAKGTASTVVVFPNLGAVGSRAVLTVGGSYTGGVFNGSVRVALP